MREERGEGGGGGGGGGKEGVGGIKNSPSVLERVRSSPPPEFDPTLRS